MFLEQHWGDIASVTGAVLALITFCVALKARSAAKSAEAAAQEATRETREVVTRALRSVDLQRAVSDARRLADTIRDSKYEVAAEVLVRILLALNDLESASFMLDAQKLRGVKQLQGQLRGIQDKIEMRLMGADDAPSRLDIVKDAQSIMHQLMEVTRAFTPTGDEERRQS